MNTPEIADEQSPTLPLIVLPPDRSKEVVVLLIGSPGDKSHADKIAELLENKFGISTALAIASAHKNTPTVLKILEICNPVKRLAYGVIVGMSNALGGVVEAHTTHPVINSPVLKEGDPYGLQDIPASYRMPSGIGSTLVIGTSQTAVALAKCFTNENPDIATSVADYQRSNSDANIRANAELQLAQQVKFRTL